MPDFIPAPQLPTGLAEQLISLKSREGDPWAALAQGLGNSVKSGIANYRERAANKPLTPEQIDLIQKGQTPPGLTRDQGLSLAEKQATLRAVAGKTIVPVDAGVLSIYKTAGLQPPGDPHVSQREFDAVSKLAQNAQKASLKPPSAYENMDGLVDGVHQFVATGGKEGTDPAQIPGFGQNSLKSQMLASLNKKYPGDFKGLAAAGRGDKALTAGQSAEARAPASSGMFKIRAMAESLVPQLDNLVDASDAVARGDIKLINKWSGKLGTELSAQDWSNLKKRAMIVADEFQAQIGAGSDAKLDLAKQLIDSSDSAETLKNAAAIMREAVKARAIASKGGKPTGKEISSSESKENSAADPLGLGL